MPSFDSPSIFGSLLDREAGSFRFGPFGIFNPTAARYVPGTNVLETTYRTPSGWVVVRDALTIGPRPPDDVITPHRRPPTDQDADHLLVRTIECVEGHVDIEMSCTPGVRLRQDAGDLGAAGRRPAHRPRRPGPRSASRCSGSGCTPTWPSASRATGCGPAGSCRPATGRTAPCPGASAWSHRPQWTTPWPGSTPRSRYWRRWLSTARIPDHRWSAELQRSALTIKGLTYAPTGAAVAALTTSLPETPRGERNWDYRFAWMRDATFTLQALHWLNLDWEADEFMQFLADVEPNDDGALQIMYGINGERDLIESTLDDLSGYDGARPVRVGNSAYNQRQNDVFGAVLDSILLHSRRSLRLPRRLWPLVEAQAECAAKAWREPDQGIWEARGAPRHYVSSKLMTWVAMDRAAELAEIRGDPDRLSQKWGGIAEEIRARHPGPRGEQAGRAAPALRHRRAGRLHPAGRTVRLPEARRPDPAGHGGRDRERAHRGRLRPALPHRRDRRRHVRQGGLVPHLLVLAGLRAGPGRRDRTGPAT